MSTETAPAFLIEANFDYSGRINFAFQQNAIPVIRRLELRNRSDEDLRDLVVRILPKPEWAEAIELSLSFLAREGSATFSDLPVTLKLEYLANLSDRVRGEIEVEVVGLRPGDAEAAVLYQRNLSVEVYAFDEWTGLETLPEILAAFVTPNTAPVETLLSRSADLLGQRSNDASLDGYQQKSKKRVYQTLECLYDALREQAVRYSNPPASFETHGQRVRFGEQILRSKLATCLDLSLLFVSAIEAAGLRPIVLMHQGHAYVGCWLIEDSLAEPCCDDLQSLRKRVALEEIVVFESTYCCSGNDADFARAVGAAEAHLDKDLIFQYALCVFRARASGIRPLPIARGEAQVDLEAATDALASVGVVASNRSPEREFAPELEPESLQTAPVGRVEHWKQQLLDLTLRNRLLNFRETKLSIPLVCPHPERLEDDLAASKSFKVLESSKLMAGMDPRSAALQGGQFGVDPLTLHLEEEMQALRLRSSLNELELTHRLTELYRKARSEMEESGANTLYLALGFLEWKETKQSDRSHRAPILLIPLRLDRKSVSHGFSIQRLDEDAMVNVTLLEMLKRDFEMEIPGVNPPPEDEHGIDAPKTFRLFQQAVKDMPGWEVRREVWLAQFSFNKFLLWKDLNDRMDSLSANSVVDHLVKRPGEPFVDEIENVDPAELDDLVACDEVYCPLSADSSQLAAIVAAARGKNYVMQGPPGTGKSQTIANLIAHCLAMGKRVLFVAEKRAALEVVHKRLSQIGLGPFCLELHSNKTGKADVLRQFGESLDFAQQSSPDEWNYVAGQLGQARAELNLYARELHKVYPNGLSAYGCYSWLIANRESEGSLAEVGKLRIEGIETQSREDFESMIQLCEDLRLRGNERRLSKEAKAGLHPFGCVEWTPDWEEQLFDSAQTLREQATQVRDAHSAVAETLGLGEEPIDRIGFERSVALSRLLIDAPVVPSAFIEDGGWEAFADQVRAWIEDGRQRDALRRELKDFKLSGVLALDTEPIRARFEELSTSTGFWSRWRQRRLLKPVRALRVEGQGRWALEEAPAFFVRAQQLQALQAKLDAARETARRRLGDLWSDGEADWDALEKAAAFGDSLHASLEDWAGPKLAALLAAREKLARLLPLASEMLSRGKPIAVMIDALAERWSELSATDAHFRELGAVKNEPDLRASMFLERIEELVERLNLHRRDLQSWCRWQRSVQAAERAQLDPLLKAVELGVLDLDAFRFAFEKRYRENFLSRLVALSEVLREFWGDEHHSRIDRFNELDSKYTDLTAQAAIARLAAELPRARREECPRNTELGILQRERSKKARHKPLRRLFSEIPSIAPRLKPCFLMSPLSVAQYLDVKQDNFDIVVFDEASQIPVWDAVGAIARGKQVIVVGDPKQLPPTNFFGRADVDEDAIDDGSIQDLESILDECLGSGLNVYNLRWHYRSRKEGLIAFSNRHYYEGGLFTFPSPHSENIGVRLVDVPEGFYDKSKSRTNAGEADAIKAEVVRRLRDPILNLHSIGIVTFSQAQQTLVLDKLDEARREFPEIEPFFSDELEEPIFVKNLENVQGDERDVIIFSVCYGPDQNGKVSMNFGPLNRSGGERRLNVAITRAKQEIIVFSTLRSERIDLTRTRAVGVEHLKAYLEYAERGALALSTPPLAGASADSKSMFELQVAQLLRENGYEVDTQVGCSGYRIDLAVVDPLRPGHYLVGVECDGSVYRQAATARDRDRLRRSVLEGLGWRMLRVWSADWWRDYDAAASELLAAVQMAVSEAAAKADGSAKPCGDEPSLEEGSVLSAAESADDLATCGKDDITAPLDLQPPAETIAPRIVARALPYPTLEPQLQRNQETFYEPLSFWKIRQQMLRIIEAEGPIVESLLVKRVAEEWQFARVTFRIKEILTSCFPAPLAKSEADGRAVYWPSTVKPSEYISYRIPTLQPQSRRALEDIPGEELRNAALDALERYVSFPSADLPREIARQFGIARMTSGVQARMEQELRVLSESGAIYQEGELIKLRD